MDRNALGQWLELQRYVGEPPRAVDLDREVVAPDGLGLDVRPVQVREGGDDLVVRAAPDHRGPGPWRPAGLVVGGRLARLARLEGAAHQDRVDGVHQEP
jgi:hypothetical protein